jgi:holo-[acyl-carrier protein] synthase
VILGVGVDIVEISRMGRLLQSPWAELFVNRVFSQEEIRACRESAHPAEGFSARFAAKEAVTKALGTGFKKGVSPDQIIVKGGEHSQPSIILEGYALELAESMHVGKIHVSLTHSRNAACAFVVIEKRR